jgi:hypothetical protein
MSDERRRLSTLYGGGTPPRSPGRDDARSGRPPPDTPQRSSRPARRRARQAATQGEASQQPEAHGAAERLIQATLPSSSEEASSPRGAFMAASMLGPVAAAAAGALAHALTGGPASPRKGVRHEAGVDVVAAAADDPPRRVSRVTVATIRVGPSTREQSLAALRAFVEVMQVRVLLASWACPLLTPSHAHFPAGCGGSPGRAHRRGWPGQRRAGRGGADGGWGPGPALPAVLMHLTAVTAHEQPHPVRALCAQMPHPHMSDLTHAVASMPSCVAPSCSRAGNAPAWLHRWPCTRCSASCCG